MLHFQKCSLLRRHTSRLITCHRLRLPFLFGCVRLRPCGRIPISLFDKKVFLLIFFLLHYLFSRVHATLQPAFSVGRLVGPSVTLYFFYDFISLTSLLLPKWSDDLKYGPCPPARDFDSRVSGLVFIQTDAISSFI